MIVEPARDAVAAHDLVTGARVWRTPLPSRASAHELVELSPGRLLVHTERALVVLEIATGAIVAQHAGPRGFEGAFLWQNAGACGLRATCALQLVDCTDARPFGPPMGGRRRSRMRADRSGWDSGCWGFSPDLVGRGGSVVVVSGHETPAGERGVVGVDVATGRQVWRRPASGRSFSGGASPDGSLCWVIDDEDALRAFDCRTGNARFGTAHAELALWSAGPPAGLFVLSARSAALLEPRRGRRLWARRLGPNEVALVAGARFGRDLGALDSDHDRTLSVLAPRGGAVLAQVPLPAGEHVVAGSTPGALRVTDSAREVDPSGTPRELADAIPLFEVERGPASSPATVFVRRPARRQILRLASDGWSLGEHTHAGTTYLALFVWNPSGPGEVRILSEPRP